LHYYIALSIFLFSFYFLPHGTTAVTDQGLLIFAASRSHSDTLDSVGLLWTSDQPNAETCVPDEIRNRIPSKRTATGIGRIQYKYEHNARTIILTQRCLEKSYHLGAKETNHCFL
jgi:replication-associated recombination protein RarA